MSELCCLVEWSVQLDSEGFLQGAQGTGASHVLWDKAENL